MNPTDAAFWKIIEAATNAGPLSGTRQRAIAEALQTATADEIDAFNLALWGWFRALGRPALRVAAERLMGERGEGPFNDFRSWLILQGKEQVERVMANPDLLGSWTYLESPRTQGLLTIGLRVDRARSRSLEARAGVNESPPPVAASPLRRQRE